MWRIGEPDDSEACALLCVPIGERASLRPRGLVERSGWCLCLENAVHVKSDIIKPAGRCQIFCHAVSSVATLWGALVGVQIEQLK